ncbi:MAG: GFA family protein [Burkholderiaceae bacterium]|nr:GFA family protein [Burkholderiaceae bacterium]
MSNERSHSGSCFCGSVQFTVTGEPAGMGYCHCESCRQWSAAPVNAFTLWHPHEVTVTRGVDRIGTYHRTEGSLRKWCRDCGGHLYTEHPGLGLVDVYAAMLPDLPFDAGVHVNYEESVLPIRDGLPKYGDFPAELNGSGRLVAE